MRLSTAKNFGHYNDNCQHSQLTSFIMTQNNQMVNNVTMSHTPEELRELFESRRNELGLSKRAYAKKLGISYDRVQSWFRPDRTRNRINHEDSVAILNDAGRPITDKIKRVEDITLGEVITRLSKLENSFNEFGELIKKLNIRVANSTGYGHPDSKNHSKKE